MNRQETEKKMLLVLIDLLLFKSIWTVGVFHLNYLLNKIAAELY